MAQPWAEAGSAGGMTGVFGTLVNQGEAPVVLTGASAEGVAGAVQLHETVLGPETGSTVMQRMQDPVGIAPGESYALEPGADHIMLLDLRRLLVAGSAAGVGAASALGLDASALGLDASALGLESARHAGVLAPAPQADRATPQGHGQATEPFHGSRQAGVATAPQAFAAFMALDLHRDTNREPPGTRCGVCCGGSPRTPPP